MRVVVIDGKACHVVTRLSCSPVTNLHLLNDRADPAIVRRKMGERAWNDAMGTCEIAMACFPNCLHGGLDLLIGANFRHHAILEVNAFGDLLPGTLWREMDTYEAEIRAILDSPEPIIGCTGKRVQ